MQKRNRSRNFVPCEKVLLAKVIDQYRSILYVKCNTKIFNKQKEEAWQNIAIEFNHKTQVGIPRTADQLKNLWENCNKDLLGHVNVDFDMNVSTSQYSSASTSPKRPRLEVDLTDLCENLHQFTDQQTKEMANEQSNFVFRPIRLTDPASFESPLIEEDPQTTIVGSDEAQLRLSILETQLQHQRAIFDLEIKLAKDRIDNERKITEKTLELLNLKIAKEQAKSS